MINEFRSFLEMYVYRCMNNNTLVNKCNRNNYSLKIVVIFLNSVKYTGKMRCDQYNKCQTLQHYSTRKTNNYSITMIH